MCLRCAESTCYSETCAGISVRNSEHQVREETRW